MKRFFLFSLVLLAAALARAEETSSSTVKAVSFSGNVAFDAEVLQRAAGLQKGTTFQAGDDAVAAGLVKSHYVRNGYLLATATSTAASSETGWTVRMGVNEGPLYRFGETHYEGLQLFPRRVARFGARYKKGDPYVQALLFETQSDLYGTGYFQDVTISASTSSARTADVLIRFKERPTKWLKGGVGYGSEEHQRASLILEHDNLFRRAYHAQLTGTWSAIWTEYAAEFVNPYFFDTRTEYRASSSWRNENREGYNYERTRGETSLGRKLTKTIDGSVALRLDRNVVYDREEGIALTTPDQLDARSVAVSANRTTTNDFFFPSRGARTRASIERFGGGLHGDLSINRYSLESFHYHPLWRQITGAVALRGGFADAFGTTEDVPIFERLFMGGANSVRGYKERGVGPRSTDDSPLGARRRLGSSIEARFPLFWLLRGAVFVDGGQVSDEWSGVAPRLWKYSAGGGLRFVTPVGPFRLDAAYKLNRDDGDLATWGLHFSLGEAF